MSRVVNGPIRASRPLTAALVVLCAAGVARIATSALPDAPAVAGPLAAGTLAVAAYAAVLALVVRGLDRWRLLRRPAVLTALAWGALVAIPLAGVGNGGLGTVFTHLLGARAGSPLTPVLAAPVVEEILKVLGVLAALAVAGRRPCGPQEAMLLGSVSGLGFQFVENVKYLHDGALWDPVSDADGVRAALLSRVLSGVDGHWVYTALGAVIRLRCAGGTAGAPRRRRADGARRCPDDARGGRARDRR